jgi:hypothetical protein
MIPGGHGMKTPTTTLLTLLPAFLMLWSAGQAQQLLRTVNPGLENFIVLIRDASTKSLIKEADISVRSYSVDGKIREGGVMGHTYDGIVQLGLGGGRHQLAFEAKGYHPMMVKDCIVRSTDYDGNSIQFGAGGLRFIGKTFLYTVFLESCNGRSPRWRFQPFLSDTIYYSEPQVPPELVGGVKSLKEQLGAEALGGSPRTDGGVGAVTATTFIGSDGQVTDVDVYGEAPRTVLDKVSKAIRNTQFTPAMILGNAVRSRVFIPFEFALTWKVK